MKKNIANSKGVTLIALVITIIVLLILASIVTYSGMDIIESSKLATFTAEMKIMQTQVSSLYDKWKRGEVDISTLGKGLDYNSEVSEQKNKVLVDELYIDDTSGYRYYDQETIQDLGIEGVKQEFFINVEQREVISYRGLKYDGDMYYTLIQLPDGLYNVDYNPEEASKPTFNLSYERIGNNQWKVTISDIQYDGYVNKWTVKYKLNGKDYENTTEDLSFVVNEAGVYNVTLEHENAKIGTEQIFVNKVNKPKLSEGMIPIKWENSNWIICSENDPGWYNYIDQKNGTDGTSKWANVMLSDGKYYATNSTTVNKTGKEEARVGTKVAKEDLGSMFVWIPRYAYQIESGYHSSDAGKINISFLKGTKQYSVGSSIVYTSHGEIGTGTISNSSGQGNWNEHPAFQYGNTTIEGIWVAKFEASSSNPSATNGGGDVTNLNVKVLPGVISWRSITVGNMYTNCINMNNSSNASIYGISADDTVIDPHLMKNSEWGVVAYLKQSSYGRNGIQVNKNNSGSYITGSAGDSSDTQPDVNITNDYTSRQGVLASTTGNVTGIYDMSGGAAETVAAYIENGNGNLLYRGRALVETTREEHKDVYSGNDDQVQNYENTKSIYGDAIYETSQNAINNEDAWFGTHSEMLYSMGVFFARGGFGRIVNGVDYNTSLFGFIRTDGGNLEEYSFRPTMVVY